MIPVSGVCVMCLRDDKSLLKNKIRAAAFVMDCTWHMIFPDILVRTE